MILMPAARNDPYQVLGISRDASEAEIRAAYHRLAQLHHPDHNGGSVESSRRFEQVQEAYAEIRRSGSSAPPRTAGFPPPAANPDVESRLADLERQVREAHAARERARQAAREAARKAAAQANPAAAGQKRPTDEELGYYNTDDSFSKILADARSELAARIGEGLDDAQTHPAAKRVGDLIDELAAKLRGEKRD